ncbi:MAG: class I SAM-dependent methyltransferase [Candidatus Aminicenantes bacterium]|nr:class I SAM-dependent methyltransferase [Candidatus Aminicenantes bacterium]
MMAQKIIYSCRSFAKSVYIFPLILFLICIPPGSADSRDKWHQPDKVMDVMGVQEGMIIGEVGAGRGYFTFKLARRVGNSGRVYANDISKSALQALRKRCRNEGVSNIETIEGEVDNPLLPNNLDMVFIVNAFHDFAAPVALLNNLSQSLKPNAPVVIMDRDPTRLNYSSTHFMTKEEVLRKIEESVFVLDRIEIFLPQHNIYILRLMPETSQIKSYTTHLHQSPLMNNPS